jgi:hypothetical protein
VACDGQLQLGIDVSVDMRQFQLDSIDRGVSGHGDERRADFSMTPRVRRALAFDEFDGPMLFS